MNRDNGDTKRKINQLVKDEGLKRQLLAVLIDSENEVSESDDSSISSYSSISSSNSSEVSCSDLDDCQCKGEDKDACLCALNGLSINVLSKEDSLILDIIDQMTDEAKKREMIERYIQIAKGK